MKIIKVSIAVVVMSVRELKNYDEWPYWYELASTIVTVSMFKIVRSAIHSNEWRETPSSVVEMSRNDLVEFYMILQKSRLEMASSPTAMMSILGGFDSDTISLRNDSTLAMMAVSLSGFFTGREIVEPLECTPDGKAWLIMCEYLRYNVERAFLK